MTSVLGVLVLALGVLQPVNQCDTPRPPYNPCVDVPVNLWFCGRPAREPLEWTLTLDGVDQPSPGVLGLVSQGVAANGLVEYTSPGPYVTVPSVGPHTLRVVYGADAQVVTVSWIGSTVVKSVIGVGPDLVCPAVQSRAR